jgi:hypothetical protein
MPAIQRLYHRLFGQELWVLTEVRSLPDAMPDVGPKLQSL